MEKKASKIGIYIGVIALLVIANVIFIALNCKKQAATTTGTAASPAPAGASNFGNPPVPARDMIFGLALLSGEKSFDLTDAQKKKLAELLKRFMANAENDQKIQASLVKLLDDRQKKAVLAEDYMKVGRELTDPQKKAEHLIKLLEGGSADFLHFSTTAWAQEKGAGAQAAPGAPAPLDKSAGAAPGAPPTPPGKGATAPPPGPPTPGKGEASPPPPVPLDKSGAAAPGPPPTPIGKSGAASPAGGPPAPPSGSAPPPPAGSAPAPPAPGSVPPPPSQGARMPGQAPPPPSGETSPLNLVPLDALIAILDMKATADKGFFSAAQKAEVLAQVRLAIKTLEEAKMLDADFNAVVTDPQKTAMRTLQSQGIFKKLQEKNLPMSAVNLAPIVLANLQK